MGIHVLYYSLLPVLQSLTVLQPLATGQAPGRVKLDWCAQARQALPPVGGARQGSLGPAYPGAARTADPRRSLLLTPLGASGCRRSAGFEDAKRLEAFSRR